VKKQSWMPAFAGMTGERAPAGVWAPAGAGKGVSVPAAPGINAGNGACR
jgi:hypothetical protein